jgi:hypothetical protein
MRSPALRPGLGIPAALLIGISLSAQAPQVPAAGGQAAVSPPAATVKLPAAAQIIERHIKAIGGREALMRLSSRHVTGTMSMPATGITGTFETFEAKPNKAVMRITIAGVGDMQEGFNGTIGWSINPMSGPSLLEGKQLEEKKFDADFFGEAQPEKRYSSMTTTEQVDFEGRPCYKVTLVRRDGGEDIQFYDASTGLRAGTMVTRESQMGSVNATVTEGEYKRFGRILFPTKIVNTAMGLQQVMTIESVTFDKVEPSVFEPPDAIKALIK